MRCDLCNNNRASICFLNEVNAVDQDPRDWLKKKSLAAILSNGLDEMTEVSLTRV